VPPPTDEDFIAGWERARDFLAERNAFSATTLHRALREDADFRFVNVARVDSPDVWRNAVTDPGCPGREVTFKSHPGLYAVVRERGSIDEPGGTVLINPFEVDTDEEFLVGWERADAAMSDQPGFMGTRLHRALGPADFRFVNVARWSSPLAFSRALQRPAFQDASAAMSFPAHPALYAVIRD
jgi:hypothetical protein